jgi:hypothetical protein
LDKGCKGLQVTNTPAYIPIWSVMKERKGFVTLALLDKLRTVFEWTFTLYQDNKGLRDKQSSLLSW